MGGVYTQTDYIQRQGYWISGIPVFSFPLRLSGQLVYLKILKYIGNVKEAGKKWGISGRMATYYCVEGRIKGVIRKGSLWLVPIDAEKPVDRRCKDGKNK